MRLDPLGPDDQVLLEVRAFSPSGSVYFKMEDPAKAPCIHEELLITITSHNFEDNETA